MNLEKGKKEKTPLYLERSTDSRERKRKREREKKVWKKVFHEVGA